MPLCRLLPATLLALLLLPLGALAQWSPGKGSVVTTERVRAELLAHAPEGVGPGKPVWVGLQITHQPEWHTYWKNPGDSGLPTSLAWSLPAGVSASEIAWPAPKKIPIGNLANYGYEGTVLLPVPLTVSPDFRPGPLASTLDLRLKASWLVCKKECIPEDGEFALQLPLQGSTGLHGAAFQAAFDAQPRALPAGGEAQVEGSTLKLRVAGLPASARGQTLVFFPEVAGVVEPAAAGRQSWDGAVWTAEVPLAAHRSASPARLPLVVAQGGQAWRSELPVQGTWTPATAVPTAISPALEQALRNNEANSPAPGSGAGVGLLAALLGAVVGGLLLNLMPCVFPVLAVKVVGFTRQGLDRRAHRIGGLAYAAGVVLSFLALGVMLLALRAAGEQLGWGFQLQSPWVVAGLAGLFTVIGLNLCGVFEFGRLLPSRMSAFEARHPVVNSMLSGVLAVAIASPCTAPFMGASLGLAVALPPAQALLVFVALGLGMALPYLAASWLPSVVRCLPRPGAWMDTFRRLMAFPMFGTVAWLVWVLGQQSGIDGAGALLALLVALSLLVWALAQHGRARLVLGGVAVVVFAALAWITAPQLTAVPAAARVAQGPWQPWSAARVSELVDSGRPVFVDFTAAWCVTCQYNKQTTLARGDVMADFAQRGVSLLRADWTRRDPAITQALAGLGRSGVPVYVLYVKGRAPVVLSEVLSASELRTLIASL